MTKRYYTYDFITFLSTPFYVTFVTKASFFTLVTYYICDQTLLHL